MRSPGVMERHNGSLGVRDDDDDESCKTRVKNGGEKISGTYTLSGTGIAECLKIVDVGCNLRQ